MPHAEALANLRAGRPQAAKALLETALRRQPADARGWFLIGACYHALNDLSAASAALLRSLELDSSNAQAHLAYITIQRSAGDAPAALVASERALAQCPGEKHLQYARALCLEDAGRPQDALSCYDAALSIESTFEDALHNRGLLLARLGRLHEAETNNRKYAAAHPQAARAHCGLADIQLALGRFDEALVSLSAAEHIARDDIGLQVRRGVALASLHRFDEAKRIFDHARGKAPGEVAAYLQRVAPGSDAALMLSPENIYLSCGWKALGECEWSGWDEYVATMREVATDPGVVIEPAVAFMSRLLPLSGRERHEIARRVAARVEKQVPALPVPPSRTRTRLRVGVLSPDFREHLNCYLLLPLFELLDRDRFELYAFSLAEDDGSDIRRRLLQAADGVRNLRPLSDGDAARAIREDDVDILIDVGGHTTGARFAITAQRPARIQVNYLGFSGSLASARVDHALIDRIVEGADEEWTEQRTYLPHTHFLYDYRAPAPNLLLRREDYGLPDDAFVYCAFHRAEKITPDVFDLWMRILSRVPRAILWFRALSESARSNLRVHARHAGIDPARLCFAAFEPSYDPRYFARHRLGDLMLDSLHHNAMTSACDALGAGLPLLTVPGDAMAARAGASLVRAAGLPELVARDREDYVGIAAQLAREPEKLRVLKERLRVNRWTAPLFDTAGRVRELERAFQSMYDRMTTGEAPTSFEV